MDGNFQPGFLCYGVPVGTDLYVTHMLEQKVEELAAKAQQSCKVLGTERQALWTTLRQSLSQTLDYWMSLVHPTQIEAAANRMDEVLWSVLEVAVGSHIPRGEEVLGYEHCPQPPVHGLGNMSFQSWVAHLPHKQGGLGIRRQVDISPVAYIGALEQTLPSFHDICPPLRHLLGTEEHGEDRRWEPLIASGCRTGRELVRAWDILQREARESAGYLGQEVPSILDTAVEAVGLGSVDGSTRRVITQEREKMRAAVLRKALTDYPDPSAKPVIAWRNRDKLTTAFLQELPGPHSSLSSPQFGEAMCLVLVIPSLCCRDRVGMKIGRRRVDPYGEEVVNENVAGGGFTRRHDRVKTELASMAIYCGLNSTVEPYGLFGSLLPQQPLNRLQYRQSKVVLRPDLLLHLPSNTSGVNERRIADVKTVSLGGRSFYKPGMDGEKAVEIRAKHIQNEYDNKAKKMDAELGHGDGQGPALRRLRELGSVVDLCFGGYAEASTGVWRLLDHMATARLAKQGLARGMPGSASELATITSRLRRRLSRAVMEANVSMLLERMSQIGDGAVSAGRRRQWVMVEERRAECDRSAQWLARVRGTDLRRRGQFLE